MNRTVGKEKLFFFMLRCRVDSFKLQRTDYNILHLSLNIYRLWS